jgi:hypothetical protein
VTVVAAVVWTILVAAGLILAARWADRLEERLGRDPRPFDWESEPDVWETWREAS